MPYFISRTENVHTIGSLSNYRKYDREFIYKIDSGELKEVDRIKYELARLIQEYGIENVEEGLVFFKSLPG